MSAIPDFDAAYRGEAITEGLEMVPWNIGEPQPPIAALIADGQVASPVLDAGCGVGATTLDLTARGYEAVGLDSSSAAIAAARRTAAERGLDAEFAVADITAFTGYDGRFATVIDSTLFHSMPVEARSDYLRAVARASRPGAVLHVLVFDVTALFPEGVGPNCVTASELRDEVEPFWDVDRIGHSAIHARIPPEWAPDLPSDAAGRRLYPAHLLTAHLPG
ncbi:class I SAM-dependent methyltransferase [Actinomycetospora endophytica]|uniref:Class I SAM-dependent methyltransferase n=1 Tax=Actinomycetospora endophytica TaxID=2291215 RepID=A0ABS8PCW4_9PSEU|nr:class I SAM-dependent methyltransferase [Actinomycetospora endophytica]MCD2196110.1 class I SAM-dependent methyltransferase [Actinomycetospora endophytica]